MLDNNDIEPNNSSLIIEFYIMKKVALFAAVVFAFGLTACKKDYTCECTVTDSSGTIATTTTSTTINATKSDAESACDSSTSLGTITTTCAIK